MIVLNLFQSVYNYALYQIVCGESLKNNRGIKYQAKQNFASKPILLIYEPHITLLFVIQTKVVLQHVYHPACGSNALTCSA